jgi:hypothetical protein
MGIKETVIVVVMVLMIIKIIINLIHFVTNKITIRIRTLNDNI